MKLFRNVAIAFSLLASTANAGEIPVPKGRVSDFTGTLTDSQVKQLDNKLSGMYSRLQMVIAVFPDMDGEDVASFSNTVFNKWGVGKRGEDRGLLLLVAKKERKVRMEVGYGLESELPDHVTKQMIMKFAPVSYTHLTLPTKA